MKVIYLTIFTVLIIIASVIGPGLASSTVPSSSSGAATAKDQPQVQFGAINAPLVIFWSQPDKKYIQTSFQAAANPGVWAKELTLEKRQWLEGKADTMALFGERVIILDRKGDWLKVAAAGQPAKLNALGYPGWVLAKQVTINQAYLEEQVTRPQVIITVPKTVLYRDIKLTKPRSELSWQVKLPLTGETRQVVEVRLPDGTTGFLPKSVTKKSSRLKYSSIDIINQARQFLGQHYLWAGTSAYGFDCSGFTYRLYQSQGISIPRDADDQAREGVPIAKEDLLPGDLLFFATDSGQGEIHHVGIYSGNGMMIHAPNNRSEIEEEPFDTGTYSADYWGARRYCP
jgi:hypothetical protein